jgi:protein-L-isoaspartate O-methyltransferase
VRDQRVLDAVRVVPRAAFVPVDRVEEAYRDGPVAIPHGQVTTQPSLVARMIGAREIDRPGMSVPGVAIDPDVFFDRLSRAGIGYTVNELG